MLAGICCQGGDTVAVVDLDTHEHRGPIPVGGHPVDAIAVDGRVFVATMDERSIDVVDTDGSVRTLATGVLGPSHFARVGDRLFVTCTGGDAVAAIDAVELELVGRGSTGPEPHGIVAHGGLVYAGSRVDGSVTVFDPASLDTVATVTVDGAARLQGMAANDAVYAVDQAGARVVKLGRDGIRATAPVGANPYELTVDAEDTVYVPGRDDGTVHAYDAALTDATVYDVGPGAVAVARLGGRRWVACADEAALRSLEGATVPLPYPATGLEAIDAGRLLVAHRDDSAVSVVRVDDERLEATIGVDDHPQGMVVI